MALPLAAMTYTLKLKIDTWLKQSTAQGASLPDDKRLLIRAGNFLPLTDFSLADANHLKVELGKDKEGNQLNLKGFSSWYVYGPAASILQDGQPIDLKTRVPLLPTYTLKVNIATWFKQSMAQSSTLPSSQKEFVDADNEYPLASFTPAGKYHLKILLGLDEYGEQLTLGDKETWYVYRPAVEVLQNGQVVEIPGPEPKGPVYSCKVESNTWFKQSTAQSSTLPDDQKVIVREGTIFPLASFQAVGKYHIKLALGLDKQGKQVTLQNRNTWYAYRPVIELMKDGESVNLFGPTPPEETSDYQLKVEQTTWLKLSTAQSSSLPENERELLQANTLLPLVSYMLEGNHLKVTFGKDAQGNQVHFKGRNTWYIYEPAVKVLYKGKPVDFSAPTAASGKTNAKGLRLIKSFEGLRLNTYIDAVGVWTIGYGTTRGVRPGMRISEAQAEAFLRKDLDRFEAAVTRNVKVPINDDQFAALVAFTYNVGDGALASSTLLRLLNQRDYRRAADEFLRWNKGGGRVLAGLTRRRRAERALFLGEDFTRFL